MIKNMARLPNLVFQPYIDPYVGNANKEIDELGQVLNERFDRNVAKWDELDAFANQLQFRQNDAGIKDSILNDTRNMIKEIREKGNWENAKLPIREVAKRLANDPTIKVAQENLKREQEYRDRINKAREAGINMIDFSQDKYNQSTIDPETGRARYLNFTGDEKQHNYLDRMKSIFEGVQADGYQNSSSHPTGDLMFQIGSGSGARYISKDKIQDIAKRNLDTYLNTEEGNQRFRVLTTKNSMNSTPVSEEQAKKIILDELTNTGMTRTFKQTSSSSESQLTGFGSSMLSARAQAATQPVGDSPQLEQSEIKSANFNPAYKGLVEKLQWKEGGMDLKGMGFGGVGMVKGEVGSLGKKGFGELNPSESKAMKGIMLTMGMKRNPDGTYDIGGKKVNPRQALEQIRQFAKQRVETGVSVAHRAFTAEEIGHANSYAKNGNYEGRQFFNRETGEFITGKEAEEVKAALREGKDVQFAGVYDVDNPFYDAAKSSKAVKSPKAWVNPENIIVNGTPYAVSASLSDKNKTDIDFREIQTKISRANRWGQAVFIGKGRDKEAIVSVGNGLYQIKDLKGNPIWEEPFTKEQVAKYVNDYKLEIEE